MRIELVHRQEQNPAAGEVWSWDGRSYLICWSNEKGIKLVAYNIATGHCWSYDGEIPTRAKFLGRLRVHSE